MQIIEVKKNNSKHNYRGIYAYVVLFEFVYMRIFHWKELERKFAELQQLMNRNVQLMEETKEGVEALKNTIKDVRVNT